MHETPTPELCEWCRQRKAAAQRRIGKRPGTKLPLILHLCRPCIERIDRQEEEAKKK